MYRTYTYTVVTYINTVPTYTLLFFMIEYLLGTLNIHAWLNSLKTDQVLSFSVLNN